ncbi:MAG TPA: formyltransferase family protein [Thermoanaerobaculia bacterium]|nr:formyltransferase family protein [Thermoanaerobaculia bacterium]
MLNDFRTLRVAVLCSKRAPGLDELLHHPNRGKLFDIGCVVTTETSFPDARRVEALDVPVLHHPIRPFFDAREASLRHQPTRRDFDSVTATVLRQLGIDTVVLLGYLYVLSDAMLTQFFNRIINVHDADLTLADSNGERKYAGLHSTRDAIVAGEKETRSTVHYVTEKVDAGPVLILSGRYPVAPFAHDAARAGHADVVKAYAYAHREWMMRDCWGSLVIRALEYMSAGVDQEDLTEVIRVASA